MLTDMAVRKAAAKEKPYKMSDGGGLYLLVTKAGQRYWRMDYRFAGKRSTIALGVYPAVSLAEVRLKRQEIKQQIAEGFDPAAKRKIDKITGPLASANTFKAVAEEWLEKVEQGLANDQGSSVSYSKSMIANLQRRELLRIARQLSGQSGLAFQEAKLGEQVEGVLKRRVDLVSGKFAMIEKSREFSLVPWRPVLEKQIGKQVSGIMRSSGVSWAIGRGRGGPSV